jgi:ketosteroid isomerase-like protein
MDISASRDFGISTGPWEVQEYRPNTPPLFNGYFLTVWKKQSNGAWKVILDGGSTTPPLKKVLHRFSFPSGADKSIRNPPVIKNESLQKELLDRENQFISEWGKNPEAATYISFLARESRLQLNGHLPATNADTIKVLISGLDKNMIWKPVGAGAASSGDLGFTYGLLEISCASGHTKGHYVRIWKKHDGEDWQIILEMINAG